MVTAFCTTGFYARPSQAVQLVPKSQGNKNIYKIGKSLRE